MCLSPARPSILLSFAPPYLSVCLSARPPVRPSAPLPLPFPLGRSARSALPSARLNPVTPDLDCCTFLGFPRRSRSELDRLHSWVVVDRMRLWVRVRAPSGVGRTHKVWDAALVPSSESRTNLDMAAVTPNLDAKAKQVDGHLCQ